MNSSRAEEECRDGERTQPALQRRKADRDRNPGADHRSEVWNEPSHSAQHGPDQRIWHAQEMQDDSGHDAINQIHQRLHQQLAADPAACLIERAGRDRELAVADEANQPVAQIPALEQQ